MRINVNLEESLQIHNMVSSTQALGPGIRASIWFQGCQRKCPGCMSPETRPLDGGKRISVQELANTICALDTIEGITISGGEPFLQKHSLYVFLKLIREKTDLGIIIYTGYTFDELEAMNDAEVNEIIGGFCDLIIDGEYVEELNDGKRFKGSSNQKLIFVTDRYKDYRYLYDENRRNVEITIKKGELFMYGIPDRVTLTRWQEIQKNKEKSNELFGMSQGG